MDARDPRCAANGGDHGFVRTDLRLFDEPTREERAEYPFVDEILIQAKLTARVQRCHFCACARTAGRTVNDACPGGWFVPVDFAG